MRRLAIACAFVLGCASGSKSPPLGRHAAPLASAGSLYAPRAQFGWTLIGDQPFLGGGYDASSSATAYHELFDPVAKTWSRTKDSLSPHAGHTLTYLPAQDAVLLVGHASERFERATNKWFAETTAVDRDGHTATVLASGKVLIAGGQSITSAFVPSVLYDPAAAAGARFTPAGTMVKPRTLHHAVLLASGQVLVAGGGDDGGLLDDAELYDPATNGWTATGAMNVARRDAAVARLADGRVLVVGGFDGLPIASAELFDPGKKTWSYAADPISARAGARAALLASGRVLVVGGAGPGESTTEVYDPKTNTWSKGPALAAPRWDHAAIPLSLGRVLVVGGYQADGVPAATSEIFGGLAGGEACTIDEECLSSSCASGKCTAPDAGTVDASTPDTTASDAANDAANTPPDASATPIVGDFQRCNTAAECASGFCVDGVCCDGACTEACHSCALPWSPGKCTLEPYGTDRKNACGESGACVATCDGKGGCTSAVLGTQCAVAHCTGPSTGVGPAVCAGTGATCEQDARVKFDCAPYACEPLFAACRDRCTASTECAPGFVCDAPSRACVPAPPETDEGGCSVGRASRAEATSAFAVLAVALALLRRRRTSA